MYDVLLSADGSKLYSLVLYQTVQKHSISADETMQYSQLLATNRWKAYFNFKQI